MYVNALLEYHSLPALKAFPFSDAIAEHIRHAARPLQVRYDPALDFRPYVHRDGPRVKKRGARCH